MAISAQRGEPFVLYITPSVVFQVIPLAYIAILLVLAAQFPVKVGFGRVGDSFRNHPALWWLVVIWVASIIIASRSAFPPRSVQARLHIRKDCIRFTPRRMDQRLSGESVVDAAVTAQSREILLSHNFFEGFTDGYRVIVRGDDEPEREIRVKFFTIPDAQDCRKMAEAMTAATGLPVRLVTRRLIDGRNCPGNALDTGCTKNKSFQRLRVGGDRGRTLRRRNHRWIHPATPCDHRGRRPGSVVWSDASGLGVRALVWHTD